MLTQRQSEILDFIRSRLESRSGSPSLREIMDHFHFRSPATVTSHLDLLEKKGVLRREPGRARNIVLPDLPSATDTALEIPIYGLIPAGHPSDQIQESDRSLRLDPNLFCLPRHAKLFALEVRGDSMIDAGILDHDTVILEITTPRHRDIVAALIDGETTLKRYLVENGLPFLRAENPRYPDLLPAQELRIQGVYRALLRINR